MVKYSWFKDKAPEYLNIKQVYGIVFSDNGNKLMTININ